MSDCDDAPPAAGNGGDECGVTFPPETATTTANDTRRVSGSYADRKLNYRESIMTGVTINLPACEYRKSVKRVSTVVTKKRLSLTPGEELSGINEDMDEQPRRSSVSRAFTCLTKGGTVFDGFLLCAAQEVGQSILTLPWIFSLVGMPSGILLQVFFASCALYTNYLLVNLHTEFRKRLAADKSDPRSDDPHYIVSYADIIGGLVGPKLEKFAFCLVIAALFGLSVVQVVATGSNMYLLYDGLDKRTWSIISGCTFSLVAAIPNFRHYRMMVIIANIATTYTSWYMTISAAVITPIPDVEYDAPRNVEDWFRGMVSLLFIFGGHASNIEVADVMNDHSTYDKSYFYSFLYVFTLTTPNAVTAYHTFGNVARLNQNAFGLYEQSPARDFGIVMMTINNVVAFGLFVGPLFHVLEKALHLHQKPFWMKILARLPLCGIVMLVGVAFPFFGPINSVLGAFTTSVTTYIIPLVAFNLVFKDPDVIEGMSKPIPKWAPDIKYVRGINWILSGLFIVCGVGIGGWASVTNFVEQIQYFSYFDKCYMCNATLSVMDPEL